MTDSLRSPIYVADLGAAGHVMVTGPRVRSQLKAWGLPALWLAAEHGLRLRRDRLPDLRVLAELHGARLVERTTSTTVGGPR
ncbi:MAG: hypothetical protein WBC31_00465 [Candidatus Phosphoribacter baldrii]|jgi:trehalose-6-phosphatase|nr:hypothetical protein [Dermatophilaceae bacterium]